MKRLGPELKMPKLRGGEIKVPPFLSDLYADLRDRRLLPLVALILVAIVATPILLGGDPEEPEPVPAPSAVAGGSALAAQDLTVVKAAPGLRNYKKRFAHRSPTDPFKQRYSGPQGLEQAQLNPLPSTPSGGGGADSGSGAGSSEPASPIGSEPSPPPPSSGSGDAPTGGGGSGGDGGSNDIPEGAAFFSLELDLQVTRIETKPDGRVEKKGPTLYDDVQAPAPLPGEKTPVITYLGMGSKNREPLFLISTEVTAIYGEAKCISGTGSCQLITLEEGFPVTFVYGDNDVRYKINLVDVRPVVTGRS